MNKKNEKNGMGIKVFLIIMFAVALAVIFLVPLLFERGNYLSDAYYLSQIIAGIVVIFSLVVAVRQYVLDLNNRHTNLSITRVQKAIDLSGYFKDNAIRYVPAIRYIFDRSGALRILQKIHPEQMKDFDSTELNRLLGEEDIKALKSLQWKPEFMQAIIEANDIYSLHFNLRIIKVEDTPDEDGKALTQTITVNGTPLVVEFMSSILTNVLNNMEFFAFHFCHNVADDSVVYQSLHQVYMELVELLYYYIADCNNDPADMLYSNTIKLFKKWQHTKSEQLKRHSDSKDTIRLDGTVIEN